MGYLLNFINSIANSNFAFTVLVVLLIAVSLAMVYLIYTQNRDIQIANERHQKEMSEKVNQEGTEVISNDTIEDSLEEFQRIQKEVNNADFEGVPFNKVIPEYDEQPLEDHEENEAVEEVEEYSGNAEDLESITKELEIIPREKNIELTPYEEEQESKAIISYDELVNNLNNNEVNYSNTSMEQGVHIKQVDLEKTGNVEIIREDNQNYIHEEEFLNNLKDLQKKLLS
jgi:hypothetical protein